MHDWSSLSHVRWECKYHVAIVPKYRKKSLYGGMRKQVGEILRELCRQKGVELLEGHLLSDHIHMCLSVPPKLNIAFTIGFLKGKSAVRIHREILNKRRITSIERLWEENILTAEGRVAPAITGAIYGYRRISSR